MAEITVTSDIDKVRKQLSRRQKIDLPKAVTQALNRTATQTQATAVKAVAKEAGMIQRDVKATFKIRKATWTNLIVSIKTRAKALNIIRFGAKQVKEGVIAKPWGKTRTFRGAFIANQGRTVFKRTRRAIVAKKRLPIRPVFGPSIPRELIRENTERAWRKTIRERFPINFGQALRRYFSK